MKKSLFALVVIVLIQFVAVSQVWNDPNQRVTTSDTQDVVRFGIVSPKDPSNTGSSYGTRLYFDGGIGYANWTSDNSDSIFLSRYNAASDDSELRVFIGDGADAGDKFRIGNETSWDRFVVQMNGKVGIGTGSPIASLHILNDNSPQLLLEADPSNAGGNENSNPILEIRQDAGLVRGSFGLNGDDNYHYSQAKTNFMFLESKVTGIQFVTGASGVTNRDGIARMTILPNGNIGIGTNSPSQRFEVVGGAKFSSGEFDIFPHPANVTFIDLNTGTSLSSLPEFWRIQTTNENGFGNKDGGLSFITYSEGIGKYIMTILPNGYIGIGTQNPGHKLSVEGTIAAREIIVTDAPWADFVFADDYQLASLSEVKDYISSFGHLPNIPSAEQVAAEGVGLAEMNTRLLQKVEELTLYAIEQDESINEYQDQLEAQREVNISQEALLESQEDRIARLEEALQSLLEKSGN